MSLSIFTVTKAEPHAERFLREMIDLSGQLGAEFLIGCDGFGAMTEVVDWFHRHGGPEPHIVLAESDGYLESVHDAVLAETTGDYVLRLDDDESVSLAMERWLAAKSYEADDHWCFARAHLWGDARTMLVTPHLWPDWQTRLSVRAKAGGRNVIHGGSPWGAGRQAPGVLLHHKFLVRTRAEREAIADRYDAIRPGAGRQADMAAYQVPEQVYTEFPLADVGDGYYVERPRIR
jgi:hypothetical protein